MYMDHLKLEEEMIRVVNSEEAKIVLEKTLKNLDSKALTSEGVIKNYKIDYKNIKRNPMGGISVPLIINDNNKLLVFNLLDRNQINGELSKLKNDIVRTTSDLYELLKEGGEDSEEY